MAELMYLNQFDPALVESAKRSAADEEFSVIARLVDEARIPSGARVVTRFGDIASLRIQSGVLESLVASEAVTDLEASRCFKQLEDERLGTSNSVREIHVGKEKHCSVDYCRRPADVKSTGRGSVVGVLDWGLDFAFPSFRHADGTTRIAAIWDQRGYDKEKTNRWGYGRIHTADEINNALQSADPYQALNYDPADVDSQDIETGQWQGTHGTHVMHIAAGNEQGGGLPGVAPDADLVFVHLSRTAKVRGGGNLGDSASILEAIDFIFSVAGVRPCAINMSVGAHGGPHDGMTLLEQGIDRSVWLNDGRVVVNSAGNYFTAEAHAQGRIKTGEQDELIFEVPADDPTSSEIELYYESSDRFLVEVIGPHGYSLGVTEPGEDTALIMDSLPIGHMYHRQRQVGSNDRHVDIFLHDHAPAGIWSLKINAQFAEDGRFHAWIERDNGLRPRFISESVSTSGTTGTICNGIYSVTVGAYDPHDPERPLGRFSSAGPTRDGRMKPEIIAPGVRILSAKSTPPAAWPTARFVEKSGTSMAAPHVTGALALMYEACDYPLSISDVRALLFTSATPLSSTRGGPGVEDLHRSGYGFLDIAGAEKLARDWGRLQARPRDSKIASASEDDVDERILKRTDSFPVEDAIVLTSEDFLEQFDDMLYPVLEAKDDHFYEDLDDSLLQAISVLLPANGAQQALNFALALMHEQINEDSTLNDVDSTVGYAPTENQRREQQNVDP